MKRSFGFPTFNYIFEIYGKSYIARLQKYESHVYLFVHLI